MALGTDGLITVVGDVDTITDTKASGTLTVRLSDKLVVGNRTFLPIDQTVQLNPNDGTFAVKLPPTPDDGSITYRFELVAYAYVNGQREHHEEVVNTILTADQADAAGIIQWNALLPLATPGVSTPFLTRNAADSRYLLKNDVPPLPANLVTTETLTGYTETSQLDQLIAQLMADPTSNIYQVLVNYEPPATSDPFTGLFAPTPRTITGALKSTISATMGNFTKYHLNTWYPVTFGSQSGTYLTFSGITEQDIRPAATAAESIAVDLLTGTYDAAATGVSEYDANVIVKRLAVSLAYRHAGNSAGGWGGGPFVAQSDSTGPEWQSALWAGCAGKAAWFIWNFLTDAEKLLVRNMLVREANRFNTVTVPYWRGKTGVENYLGDSKAEENAWNAMLLGTALLVAPDHANAATWLSKFLQFTVSMHARPSDLTSDVTINGLTLSTFLNGSNINDDGTIVNHGVIAPDYMTAGKSAWSIGSTFALSGKKVPIGLYHNAQYLYRAMVDVNFASPPFTSPGGTIYKGGTGDIYYPEGADWGIRFVDKASFDIHGIALGFDATASVKAETWAPLHYAKVAAQQARYTDGHTYSGTAEDSYLGREQTTGYNTGYALLAARVAELGLLNLTNGTAAEILADLQAPSTVVRAPIPAPPPAPTTAPTLTLGSATVTTQPLTWTSVAGATAYDVEHKATSGSTWTVDTTTATGNAYTVTGLTASTSYDVRVRARNAGGPGPYSSVATASTAAAGSNPFTVDSFATTSSTSIPGWTSKLSGTDLGLVDAGGAGMAGTGSTAMTPWWEAPASLQPAGADQDVQLTVGAISGTAKRTHAIGVRCSTPDSGLKNGYWVHWIGGTTNTVTLMSSATPNGGSTTVTTLGTPYALASAPTTLRLRVSGSTVEVYINGGTTPIITVTDATHTAGAVWMGARYTAVGDNSIRARSIGTRVAA